MNTLRLTAFSLAALLLGTAGVIACATDDDASPPKDPDPVIPLPGVDAALEADAAKAEGGCADAAGCVETTDCTKVDFCGVTFPAASSVALNAIWGSSATDVWAVGTRGTIVHGDGSTFTPVASGTSDVFFAVWGTGANDVWALNGTTPVHSTGFTGGTTAFVDVKGTSWNPEQAATGRVWAGYSTSATAVWLGGEPTARFVPTFGEQNSIWRIADSGDGGSAWRRAPACSDQQPCTPQVRAFWGSDGGAVLAAVGMKGQAFRLDDPDAGHWAFENPQTGNDLEALWGSGPSDLWAVGQSGTIRHATSPGVWTAVTSPTTKDLHAVWGSGPNDVWIVGDAGTVVHFDGKAWTQATIGLGNGSVPTSLRGVWGSGPDDVWIVGEGLLLHRTALSRRHS